MMIRLGRLFHRRWAVPILGELHRTGGAKLVTLEHRLGAGRTALRAALAEMIAEGWVERNPGYGHPLRPEYVVPAGATDLAAACAGLLDALEAAGSRDVGLRKWSMPVLAALAGRALRFSEVAAAVPGIGDRALGLALRALVGSGLVEREVLDRRPPSAVYRTTPLAAPIEKALALVVL